MNLPYTMNVTEAAEATNAFRPLVVTPYHYRNGLAHKLMHQLIDCRDDTLSNLTTYISMVDKDITVDLLDFYPRGP